MIHKLTAISTPIQPEINLWEPLVHAEVIRRLAPVLNIKKEVLRKAFEKLCGSLETKLFESLLIQAGDELLPLLPELAEFPEPEVVLEMILADYRADEDLLMLDPDFAADEDDIHGIIHATEKLRLLKTVLYFWHLLKVGGRELAQDTLVDTLHALALYQLLLTNGLTDLQVKYHSTTLTLLPDFKAVLQNTKVKGVTGTIDHVRELIAEKVSIEKDGEDELFVQRAIRNAHCDFDAVLTKVKGDNITLRGFSHTLLEDGMAESLAEIILDACPPSKVRS